MASRDADLRLSFAIDQARAKAAVKSVDGLNKTVKDLDGSLKTLAKTAGTTGAAVGNGLKRFSAEQVSIRNELLKGTQALKQQMSVLDTYRQKLASSQSGSGGGSSALLGRLGSTGSAVGSALSGAGAGQIGQIASFGGQISNALNQVSQLQGALGVTGASMSTLAAAAGLAGIAIGTTAVALDAFTKAIEEHKAAVGAAIKNNRLYFDLIQTGTTESLQAALAELNAKREAAKQSREAIREQEENVRRQFGIIGEADKAIEDLGSTISKVFGGSGEQHGGILAGFFNLQESAKATDEEIADLNGQIDAYTRALQSNQVAINDAKKAEEDLNQQISQNTQAIVDAREQSAKQEADILAASAKRRIDLAQQAARAEADALTRLRADIADGTIRASQQQQDILVAYQDNEQKAARDHYRAMLKIRKDADNDEFDLILSRDFAGLARLRRQTDQRLQEEEDRHQEERTQRLTDLKIRLRDQQTAFVREREARQRAYFQQLTDLRQGLSRQLDDSNQAARVELDNLQKKLQAEITMKQQANALLLQIEANYQAKRRAMAQEGAGYISGYQSAPKSGVDQLSGSQIRHMATGGFLQAGQLATVNERRGQRESFSSGGMSTMLPGGMGLFTPIKSGRVDPGGGGVNVPISLVVNGNTWAEIRAQVHSQIDAKLTYAFEKLAS